MRELQAMLSNKKPNTTSDDATKIHDTDADTKIHDTKIQDAKIQDTIEDTRCPEATRSDAMVPRETTRTRRTAADDGADDGRQRSETSV